MLSNDSALSRKELETVSRYLTDTGDLVVESSNPSADMLYVLEYLGRFGYIERREDEVAKVVSESIARFQRRRGIKVVGRVDKKTMREMKKPRCGVPDFSLKIFGLSVPANPCVGVCAWENLGSLKFGFEDGFPYEGSFGRAVDLWNSFAGFELFVPGGTVGSDIYVGFRSSGDTDFSLEDPAVAHADFPPRCSAIFEDLGYAPIHFNSDMDWSGGPSEKGFNVFNLALHELGHVLGLGHDPLSYVMKEGAEEGEDDLTEIDESAACQYRALYS